MQSTDKTPEGVGGEIEIPVSSLPAARRQDAAPAQSGTPAPPPPSPTTTYLLLLSQGHPPARAQQLAFQDEPLSPSQERYALDRARNDPEFAALEQLYAPNSLTGRRPAMAKALLEHETLGSVQALVRVRDSARHERDRKDAAVALIDRSSLAPKADKGSAGAVVNVQINVVQPDGTSAPLVIQLPPAP